MRQFSVWLVVLFVSLGSPLPATAQVEPTVDDFHSSTQAESYLNELELSVLEEINRVRRDPQAYANQVLIPLRQYFQDDVMVNPPWFADQPNTQFLLQTQEGIAALEEAIEYMLQAKSLPDLRSSYGLTLAARDHVADQSQSGATSHTGSDGSSPFDRADRYGTRFDYAGENIFYGQAEVRVAEYIVMGLIIDDGVPDRGHRELIMDPRFRLVGIATGTHPTFGLMCVQVFAGSYLSK